MVIDRAQILQVPTGCENYNIEKENVFVTTVYFLDRLSGLVLFYVQLGLFFLVQ